MRLAVLLVPEERLNSLGRMHLEEHPVAGEEILSGLPGLEGRGSVVTKDPLFRGRS